MIYSVLPSGAESEDLSTAHLIFPDARKVSAIATYAAIHVCRNFQFPKSSTMKTQSTSVTLLAGIFALVLFGGVLQSHCRSDADEAEDQGVQVSVTKPDTFAANGTPYCTFTMDPQYIVFKHTPADVSPWSIKNLHRHGDLFFLADINKTFQILVYDISGTLAYKIPLEPAQEPYAGIIYDDTHEQILVGDNLNQRLILYDLKGNLKEVRKVGFHFMDFAYSPVKNRCIFYLPSDGSAADPAHPIPAIRITDASFKVLYEYFPLSARAIKVPYYTDGRFQVGPEEVYYNPDYTDKIYSIDFNGEVNLLVDLNRENPTYWATIDSYLDQPPYADFFLPLMRKLAILNFQVSPQYIMATGDVPGMINQCIVIDRKSYRSFLIQNSTPYTNLGPDPKFNFTFRFPRTNIGDDLAFLFPSKFIEEILPLVEDQNAVKHIPRPKELDYWCLMLYQPNHDVLFPEQEQETVHMGLKVFPNPTAEKCTVSFDEVVTPASMRVFSTDGIMRYDEKINKTSGSVELDVTNWTPGAYVVQCVTDKGTFAKTLMVQ